MNKDQAIRKIQESIAKGAQLITPSGETYESHLSKQTKNLLAHVIQPIEANVTSTCAPEGDILKYQNNKVWAIAHINESWLLTIESENEFALGFGTSTNNLQLHGFSSSDALAEWGI